MLTAWKLIPSGLVIAALVTGWVARPPAEPVGRGELLRLVLAVVALYAVGGISVLQHRNHLAAALFGIGLALCGFALWLSRGTAPPLGDDDGGLPPPIVPPGPPEPDRSPPPFDWSYYEDQLREPVAR